MQSENPLLADIAKLLNSAAGTVAGMGREARDAARERVREGLGGLDFVSRDEFDAVKDMAAKAREENEALTARVAALEAALKGKAKKVGFGSRRDAEKKEGRGGDGRSRRLQFRSPPMRQTRSLAVKAAFAADLIPLRLSFFSACLREPFQHLRFRATVAQCSFPPPPSSALPVRTARRGWSRGS